MDIVAEQVTVVYSHKTPFERRALDKVSFQIPSGSFCAILGKTGSGKSTLIQCLAGLIKPTSGTIRIGNQISNASKGASAIRKKVGMVFQYPEHQLFEETVYKDIAFGPTNLGLSHTEVHERVLQALDWVGLPEEILSQSPFRLSGGQMRRVAIAGILAMQTEILILDEPTAGLDPKGQRELLKTIDQLHQKRNLTVIMVTHDMDEAARYADHLLVMAEGRCIRQGPPKVVFQDPTLLQTLQLDLPEITQMIHRLNQQLIPPLRQDIWRLDDLALELAKRWREGVKE